jgi:ribosomal protein L37AE/L43A
MRFFECEHYWVEASPKRQIDERHLLKYGGELWKCAYCGQKIVKPHGWQPPTPPAQEAR